MNRSVPAPSKNMSVTATVRKASLKRKLKLEPGKEDEDVGDEVCKDEEDDEDVALPTAVPAPGRILCIKKREQPLK